MATTRTVDLRDFSQRVERLCDFLLARSDRKGTKEQKFLEDLRNDAADIQFNRLEIPEALEGLHDYVKGLDVVFEKN